MKPASRGINHKSVCSSRTRPKSRAGNPETLRSNFNFCGSHRSLGWQWHISHPQVLLSCLSTVTGCSHSLCVPTPQPPITTGKEEWLRRTKHNADGGHMTLAHLLWPRQSWCCRLEMALLMASHWPWQTPPISTPNFSWIFRAGWYF